MGVPAASGSCPESAWLTDHDRNPQGGGQASGDQGQGGRGARLFGDLKPCADLAGVHAGKEG